jgi:PEGA domain-containing protein
MRSARRGADLTWAMRLALVALLLTPAIYAGNNEVMGEILFEGKSKVEKTSGVWVDGKYVGYLKELHGSKKVLLLPGEHVISVRQVGYQEFTQRVMVQPNQKYLVRVTMERAATQPMPAVTATVKIVVNPNRAAVFVDGQFVGHVGEFDGAHQGMLVAPGPHKIKVALPGYETFETEIMAQGNQKVEVKTDLKKSGTGTGDPILNPAGSDHPTPPPPPPDPLPPQR